MQPTSTSFPSIVEANQQEEEKLQQTRNQRKGQRQRTQTEQSRQTEKKAENTALQKLKEKEKETEEVADSTLKAKETSNITSLVVQEMHLEDQPQPEYTEENNPLSGPVDLKARVNDLSQETQELYKTELRQKLRAMSGDVIAFSSDNEKYQQARDDMQKEAIRTEYRELREKEQERYRSEIRPQYERIQSLVGERIKAVQDAIKKCVLEAAVLKEAIIGVTYSSDNSAVRNLAVWIGYEKYGAGYRLYQVKNKDENGALDIRKNAIGITEEDKIPEKLNESAAALSDIQTTAAELSRSIDALKEEVLVCNQAMSNDAKSEVVQSNLPAAYYLSHKQQLEVLDEKINGKKAKKEGETNAEPGLKAKVQERILELDKLIEIEKGNPDSPQYLAYQREKSELIIRCKMIETRYKEIADLLEVRKKQFNLTEDKLKTQQMANLEDLSAECKKALNLLVTITSFKEETVMANEWERWASLEQRKIEYFKATVQYDRLGREKSTFETTTLTQRTQYLTNAVDTYREYIRAMQSDMKSMDSQFKLLESAAKERAKWQVNPLPVKPIAPAKSETPSATKPKEDSKEPVKESKSFWSGIWGSSPKTEKKPEVDAKQEKKPEVDAKSDKKPEVDAKSDKKPEVDAKSDKKSEIDANSPSTVSTDNKKDEKLS